jgi:hypothetical protein
LLLQVIYIPPGQARGQSIILGVYGGTYGANFTVEAYVVARFADAARARISV